MAKDEEKTIEQYTGEIIHIGKAEGAKKPRKVEMKDDPDQEYAKTLRIFEHEYQEDEDEEPVVSEVFENLVAWKKDGQRVTVEYEVRKYKVGRQWRTQNLIRDAWLEGEEPEGKDNGDDEPSSSSKKKTASASSGSLSDKDIDQIADRIIEKMRKAGGVVLGKPADGDAPAPEGVEKAVYDDFATQAEEEGMTEKAIQKKYDKVFPGRGDWRNATLEELTALADALDFEWK